MVMNNNGDLLLIDLNKKTTKVIKSKVALKDNNVDITAKNRDVMIPPFEFGDAHWSSTGDIYYTSFSDDTVSLHKFNPETNNDEVVKQSQNVLSIISGDRTGKWLLLSESSWATKRDKDNPFGKRYFFNTQSNQTLELDGKKINDVVWSPSGQFIAQSTGSWMSSPTLGEFPAVISNIETKQTVNVTEIVRSELGKKNITVGNKALVVEIKDFVDDSTVLLKIRILGSKVHIPRQINGILDISTRRLTVLQDYPEDSFQTYKGGRIEPLQIIY